MADEQSTPDPPKPEPMTRERAIELLKTDVRAWNKWREETKEKLPDLSGANLSGANLTDANLIGVNLGDVLLGSADLREANLTKADLSGANLGVANLTGANLTGANLTGANLGVANLTGADLCGADLRSVYLWLTNLKFAILDSSDFSGAHTHFTTFGDVDLSKVRGLESIEHYGPSTVGTDTLVNSKGRIPAEFLRGCGFQPWEIEAAKLYDPALTPEQVNDIQYKIFAARTGPLFLGGIFISYSHDDAKFVDKLYAKLMADGANVWLDRHDMVAGDMQRQIDRAIRLNDVVVLALSASSVNSDWVEHELEKARKKEKDEGCDVLCPVALDDAWKAKMGDVLWRQVKKKNVLDFSKWESDAFDAPYQKLIKGLRVNFPRKDDAPSAA